MTHIRLTGLCLALLLGAAVPVWAQAPPPGSGPVHFEGFVRVIDGDTFEVYINGHQTGIGIIGIKAPMGNTSCGFEATYALWGVMSVPDITLEEDPDIAFDARKRRMYYIVLPDGSSAAVRMAQTGLVLPTGQGRERDQITAASAAAATARCAHR